MIDRSRQISDMDRGEVVRAASSRSPSDPAPEWNDRSDSGSHSGLRKPAEPRIDDSTTLKSSAIISYTRTARHDRTATYERTSSRYADQCSDSKYRSSTSTYARRSPPDRDYRDGEDGDDYYHSSSKSSSRYHATDQHSYYSSSYREHTSSHHANHYDYRSEHYRDRLRRSESRKRSYRDEDYGRGLDRHSGLDRDDHRVRAEAKSSAYYKSASSSEKLVSSSHRSYSSRIKADDSRLSSLIHSSSAAGAVSPSSRYTSSKNSTVRRTYGDWEEHVSSNKKVYYYNKVSGVSQWEKPRELIRDLMQPHSAHPHDQSDVRSKSPVASAARQNHEAAIGDCDDDDVFQRKRSRRSTAVAKDEIQSKSQPSSHVAYHHNNSTHVECRSSRSTPHLQSAPRDSHSRSHSLLDRSNSVQSSSSASSKSTGDDELRRSDDEEHRRVRADRVCSSSTHFRDLPSESCRNLKRKNADLTKQRHDQSSHLDHCENGVSKRLVKDDPLEERNGCSGQRQKVLLDSPLNHPSDPMMKKKEAESVAASSDHNSNSSCRSQCLSPSQVTMDNLEKIIDSLADTPGLPDLRKLSREDALKTIQQVLRIMKEASLAIGSGTPTRVSPPAASNSSARNSFPNNRSRLPIVRHVSSNQVVDHEPAINGGAVFLNRQDLAIPSPSSEISGYSSTRSPSDSGVDIAVPSKPCVPSLTASLVNCFREDLIKHVQGWSADQAERQANKLAEDAHHLGSRDCTRVSAELKMARSLVRLTEIQATLQEQRILFVRQQIKDVEAWKSQHTSNNSMSSAAH